MEAALKATMHM